MNTTVVVAVSGGVDSLVLLHALHSLQPQLGYQLHVASFDHRLRGDASAQDVRYVGQVAAQWGLPFTAGSAAGEAPSSNIEAWAREARYRFLATVAQSIGAERVATAHHANDQAETVLLHLLRGSGVQGLSGMSHRATLPTAPHLTLIRPLLDVERAEIERYAAAHNLQPRQDASNDDTDYTRNRIRLHLLPELQTYNPQIVRGLTQLAAILRTEQDYMQAQFETTVWPQVAQRDQRIRIPRAWFEKLHPALQRRCVRQAVQQLRNGNLDLGFGHVQAALDVAQGGDVGALAQLPGGLHLRVGYEMLVIEAAGLPADTDAYWQIPPGSQHSLAIPADVRIGNLHLQLARTPPCPHAIGLHLPADADLMLRTRQPGDVLQPPGLQGHTQKLKAWLINAKIPRAARDGLPLLSVHGAIAALLLPASIRIMHPYRSTQALPATAYLCVQHT